MGDTARKTARADTWRVPGSPDGASRADTVAQSGKSGKSGKLGKLGKLGTRRRSNGRLATGCLGGCVGACLMLLLGCVLLSVAYPAAAQAVSTSIKATLKPIGTQRPYQTDALPARITLGQGALYLPGPLWRTR